MSDIDINHKFVKVPVRISIDKVDYPITQHNIEVVNKYWETDDEAVLKQLSNYGWSL